MKKLIDWDRGALARNAPKARSLLLAQEICSRFALIAGEGARAPSKKHD